MHNEPVAFSLPGDYIEHDKLQNAKINKQAQDNKQAQEQKNNNSDLTLTDNSNNYYFDYNNDDDDGFGIIGNDASFAI